jgi:Uri superfamily endonuclease
MKFTCVIIKCVFLFLKAIISRVQILLLFLKKCQKVQIISSKFALKRAFLYLKSTEVARNLSKPCAAVLNFYFSDSKSKINLHHSHSSILLQNKQKIYTNQAVLSAMQFLVKPFVICSIRINKKSQVNC